MLEILSIHVPKTAGTSFYKILKSHYGDQCFESVRRKDVEAVVQGFEQGKHLEIKVLHGHLHYLEVKNIADRDKPKTIAWLRDPIERLISNYHFFKAGLYNPERNPTQYELNKHRINEDILTYAERPENQNVMWKFLAGISLEQLDFLGLQEHFEEDMARLNAKMGWPQVPIPYKNVGKDPAPQDDNISPEVLLKLEMLNRKDMALYQRAVELRQERVKGNLSEAREKDAYRDAPFYMMSPKEVIMIHPVKTGGTSIRSSLPFYKIRDNQYQLSKHHPASFIQSLVGDEAWDRAFKFAFVRNPWDRLVSWHQFRVRKGTLNRPEFVDSFDLWLRHLLKSYADPASARKNLRKGDPQTWWLCSQNGKIEMDFIGRFERISEDYAKLCDLIGIHPELKSKNRNPKKVDYRDYYSDETREWVAEVYKEDIEAFAYTF